jgi:hypothetical protein
MTLPETPFFLFGMGDREKLVYKAGALRRLPSLEIIFDADADAARSEQILPDQYTVLLDGGRVVIREDARGVFINDRPVAASSSSASTSSVASTSSSASTSSAVSTSSAAAASSATELSLPDFNDARHPELLRILHHEILVNIVDGKPLPNFFVYGKPWYRDAAMMALALARTGNSRLLAPWIMPLREIYDRNNAGIEEPDNIGQALYLVSTVSDASHPLVAPLLAEARRRCVDGVLEGMTDFAPHPVYQTKWLKFGLDSLGLDSSWTRIPRVEDSYASLFWMAYRGEHFSDADKAAPMSVDYPYLWWAKEHFYNAPLSPAALQIRYPLTWESRASQANYAGIRPLSANYAGAEFSAPHTWHASEMFLRLIEE